MVGLLVVCVHDKSFLLSGWIVVVKGQSMHGLPLNFF